jgi:hypothetical protein
MISELAVALVGSIFGLIPLIVQISTTRAQRRDRMTRLNHLRAELELLEHMHTLQGKVGAPDEVAKSQTNDVISDSLSRVLEQYNNLAEIAPSTVFGGKPSSPRELSFLRRVFLLYNPRSLLGWIFHTLFYISTMILGFDLLLDLPLLLLFQRGIGEVLSEVASNILVFGLLSLIFQRLARRNASRNVARLEEPNA